MSSNLIGFHVNFTRYHLVLNQDLQDFLFINSPVPTEMKLSDRTRNQPGLQKITLGAKYQND
jgi:hypothetical protein